MKDTFSLSRAAARDGQRGLRYYGAERGGVALDLAFVFSRVEHVERVDHTAAL